MVSKAGTISQTPNTLAGDINDATLAVYGDLASSAAGKGAEMVEYQGATVEAALNERLPEIGTYALLRAYTGPTEAFFVRGAVNDFDGGFGTFRVDSSDTTSADNGGTILVDVNGKRWKRVYDGKLRPEYFGAFGRVSFTYDPSVSDGTPTGAESTLAFKAMMAYAQSLRRAVIEFAPGAVYYVSGDNPCGLQNNVNESCVINIEGNNARIYWRPTLSSDSCFGKLGLLILPQWENFRVSTLGAPGSRNGIIFNTKLGFSNIHYYSLAGFRNIYVNVGSSIGCDTVFNFESDGVNSHDDLSVYEGIVAVCYNKFVDLKNSEAVSNVFRRCSTSSYTANAVTFNVNPTTAAFSGYLDIDRHHFTVCGANETLVKTKDEAIIYPIYLRSPRKEKQLSAAAYKMLDLGSCRVVVSGLSSALGGYSSYFDVTNQYVRIGQYASVVFEDCLNLDGNIQIDAASASAARNALTANRCSFTRAYGGATSVYAFPKLKWGTYASRAEALAANAIFNAVTINDPEPASPMPLELSFGSRAAHKYKSVVMSQMTSGGKSTLQGSVAIPEDILFESLYLRVEAFATTNIDALVVDVTSPTGSAVKSYTVSFTGSAVSQELITSGKVLTLPQDAAISFIWKKSGVAVGDKTLFPESRIEAKYREIMSSREGNSGMRGEINII